VEIQPPKVPGVVRLISGVFGFAFAGIGLTTIGFLWLAPFGQFDSPPLVFRVFGSFIAIVFVAVGGTAFVSAIRGRLMGFPASALRQAAANSGPAACPLPAGYLCPHCGAPLAEKAEVSPLGDVKCPFCHTWFNIHQSAS
jgi:hypothetical protein